MKRKPIEKSTISINDVTDVTVEFKAKEVKLKPDKVYRFQCGGVFSREYSKLCSAGRKVDKEIKYRAEFSGSVEEFIYPSLRAGQDNQDSQAAIASSSAGGDPSSVPVNRAVSFSASKPPSSNDFGLHWKLDIEDKPVRLLGDGSTSASVSAKGERTLRELLRKKSRDRFAMERAAAKFAKDAVLQPRPLRKQNVLNTVYGESKRLADTPENMVSDSASERVFCLCQIECCEVLAMC